MAPTATLPLLPLPSNLDQWLVRPDQVAQYLAHGKDLKTTACQGAMEDTAVALSSGIPQQLLLTTHYALLTHRDGVHSIQYVSISSNTAYGLYCQDNQSHTALFNIPFTGTTNRGRNIKTLLNGFRAEKKMENSNDRPHGYLHSRVQYQRFGNSFPR